MRTNLMTCALAKAVPQTLADRASPRGVTLLFGSVLILAFAALPMQRAAAGDSAWSLLASSADTASQGCHKADEIKPALFPRQQIVAYDFTGPDASKLKTVMDVVESKVAPDAILVRLVLVPSTNEAIAFQFGADGCHTATVDLNWDAMIRVFQSADVHAPFGSTFYQTPGVAI